MARILIIEDETGLLDVYSEYLESEGHEVFRATDGETGFDLALRTDWDVMFLDIMLPKLDGTELLKKLNFENVIKGRPVVMLTNLDAESIVKECMTLGARNYLFKANITPDVLTKEIVKYITREDDKERQEQADESNSEQPAEVPLSE